MVVTIITCHFKNLAELPAIRSCHFPYTAVHPIFPLWFQILLLPWILPWIQRHAPQGNSRISLTLPNVVKNVKLFMPLSICICHFYNLTQFHNFLSIVITSCHLPLLPAPPIFPFGFQIPLCHLAIFNLMLTQPIPNFPVISKVCEGKNFPAACHIYLPLKNLAQFH